MAIFLGVLCLLLSLVLGVATGIHYARKAPVFVGFGFLAALAAVAGSSAFQISGLGMPDDYPSSGVYFMQRVVLLSTPSSREQTFGILVNTPADPLEIQYLKVRASTQLTGTSPGQYVRVYQQGDEYCAVPLPSAEQMALGPLAPEKQ